MNVIDQGISKDVKPWYHITKCNITGSVTACPSQSSVVQPAVVLVVRRLGAQSAYPCHALASCPFLLHHRSTLRADSSPIVSHHMVPGHRTSHSETLAHTPPVMWRDETLYDPSLPGALCGEKIRLESSEDVEKRTERLLFDSAAGIWSRRTTLGRCCAVLVRVSAALPSWKGQVLYYRTLKGDARTKMLSRVSNYTKACKHRVCCHLSMTISYDAWASTSHQHRDPRCLSSQTLYLSQALASSYCRSSTGN